MEPGRELSIPRLDESKVPMAEGPPFAGGWGYTQETACIITDNRGPGGQEVRGRDFEGLFIRNRLCAELDNAIGACGPLANTRWRARSRVLHRNADGAPAYDQFTVELRAFRASEYQTLLAEEAALAGAETDLEASFSLMKKKWHMELSCTADCWFDISYIKGIEDDDEFAMQLLKGRITELGEKEDLGKDARVFPSAD